MYPLNETIANKVGARGGKRGKGKVLAVCAADQGTSFRSLSARFDEPLSEALIVWYRGRCMFAAEKSAFLM